MRAIVNVIKQVQSNKYYGVSEEMEIAKGKYQLITTWKQLMRKIIRSYKYEKIQNSIRH